MQHDESRGAWIFLSHSHEDWTAVREIRNILEDKGHHPLVFFLKCLDDDSELHELIKREILARTWFLLCDSDRAQSSRWVQDEVALIESMPGKYYERIDLSRPLTDQLDRINALCRRATVYLSYARDDSLEQASELVALLKAGDYQVREPELLETARTWQEEISASVDDALLHGFVLILLTPNSAKKEFLKYEIEYAVTMADSLNLRGSVVPIVFGDPAEILAEFSMPARQLLESTPWYDFSTGDFRTNAQTLLADLKIRPMDSSSA